MIIILSSFTADKQSDKKGFELKVENFLNGLMTDFEESSERFLKSNHNDFILETMCSSIWSKTLTLKSKKTFKNHYGQTVIQRLYLGFHNFDTEEQCNQAFDNLMKCLGTDCQSINF